MTSSRICTVLVASALLIAGAWCVFLEPPVRAQEGLEKDEPQPQAFEAGEILAIDITGAANGRYVLEITDSEVAIVPLTLLSVVPGPTPPTPPVPDPDPLPRRGAEIKRAATPIGAPETAQKLAYLYRQIAGLIDDGTLSGQQQIGLMLSKSQEMLISRSEAPKWKPVTDLVSTHWTAMVQEGADDAEYSDYLREAADGLSASAGDKALDPSWIELVMKIIQIILELLIK